MPGSERKGVLGMTEDQVNGSAAGSDQGFPVARLARRCGGAGCQPRSHDWLLSHF
jgi:hypothetical protein